MCKIDFSTTFLNKSFPHWLYDVLFVYGDIVYAIVSFHLKIFPLNLCLEIKNLLTVKNNVYEKRQTLFFFLMSLLLFVLCAGRAGTTRLLEGTSEGCSIW